MTDDANQVATDFESKLKELLKQHPEVSEKEISNIAKKQRTAENAALKKEKIRLVRGIVQTFNISHNAVFPDKPWLKNIYETLLKDAKDLLEEYEGKVAHFTKSAAEADKSAKKEHLETVSHFKKLVDLTKANIASIENAMTSNNALLGAVQVTSSEAKSAAQNAAD